MLPVSLLAAATLLSPASGDGRSYVQGYFALSLDNVKCGWVSEVDGGHAVADVVTERLTGDTQQKKHVANIKWSTMSIRSGSGMEPSYYKWVKASFDKKYERRSGELTLGDFKRTAAGPVFTDAIITELGMPALDAASKDAAKMTLDFQPSTAEWVPAVQQGPKWKGANDWLSSRFAVRLDGIGDACERVEEMHFAFRSETTADGTSVPYIDISSITLTYPETSENALMGWWTKLLASPDQSDQLERSMTILVSTGDGVMTFSFKGVGVSSVYPERGENGAETRRIKAEMYCEDVRFNYAPAATFG